MRHHVPSLLLGASLLCACKNEEPPPPPPEDPTLARIKVGAAGVALGSETVVAKLEDKDTLLHPLIDKIEEHKPSFASCYEAGLRGNPNLQGRVAVRVDVNKRGGVVQTRSDTRTDIPDRIVAACVTTSLTNVAFPPSETRTSLLVSLGFAPP